VVVDEDGDASAGKLNSNTIWGRQAIPEQAGGRDSLRASILCRLVTACNRNTIWGRQAIFEQAEGRDSYRASILCRLVL
jgi:hypothetical protein